MIEWQWKQFKHLTIDELHEILSVRQQVFAVEQNCVYQDVDQLDKSSWHLTGWNIKNSTSRHIVAYLRVVYPTFKYDEPSIGRVLTVSNVRGTGTGKNLMKTALSHIENEYPGQAIRISAQQYLQKFYADFGFKKIQGPYDEDGIPHIEMLKQ